MDGNSQLQRERKLLFYLLRALAIMGMAAIVPVVMPHAWMNWFHREMGLGEMPDIPIVGYLARSVSLFYVWAGAIAWYLSNDLEGRLPFIRFVGGTGVGIGLAISAGGLVSGLPWWWVASEAAFAVFYFGAIWRLARPAR